MGRYGRYKGIFIKIWNWRKSRDCKRFPSGVNLSSAFNPELEQKIGEIVSRQEATFGITQILAPVLEIVKKEYYSVTGRCCIKTQTALLLTLKYHFSDNEELVKTQLRKLFDDNEGKLRTGFVGTPLMCNILSDHGMDDIAYGLLLNEEYPGWLAEEKLEATTVWERWNGLLLDGTISGIGTNSMNHYSYGAIAEWMFRHMVGINTIDSSAGLRLVFQQPVLNWELGMADASYDSACGVYQCAWRLTDPTNVEFKIRVPFGGTAELHLPYVPEPIMQEEDNPVFRDVRDGVCMPEIGVYHISYELTQSLKKEYNMDSTWQELFCNPKTAGYLKEELDMNILRQYWKRTVNELAVTFPSEAKGSKLEKLEGFLKSI